MVEYNTLLMFSAGCVYDAFGIQDIEKQIWERGGVGMKKNYFKVLVCLLAMAGVFVASTVSAYGCWFFTFYQKECPKALIRED